MEILLLSPIDPEAVTRLRAHHSVVEAPSGDGVGANENPEVLIFRSGVDVGDEALAAMPRLRLIVRAGSGFDNIDLASARRRGVRVVRIPGPAADAVAEFAMALMLAVARRIVTADSEVRAGRWPKHELGGSLLRGKVLGIVGTGNIGGRLGELAAAWGMTVMGCVAHPEDYDREALARRGIELVDFDAVIGAADFLSVNCPLDDTTRDLIDARVLSAMKPGAVLVNTARGGIVDEVAVGDALRSGRLAGAAFDVHEVEGDGAISPLAAFPNVVLSPHIAAMAHETQRDIGRRVIELIDAFIEGRLDEVASATELLV
jgi:phosphoglycerate dehydrogenase-like enzyme